MRGVTCRSPRPRRPARHPAHRALPSAHEAGELSRRAALVAAIQTELVAQVQRPTEVAVDEVPVGLQTTALQITPAAWPHSAGLAQPLQAAPAVRSRQRRRISQKLAGLQRLPNGCTLSATNRFENLIINILRSSGCCDHRENPRTGYWDGSISSPGSSENITASMRWPSGCANLERMTPSRWKPAFSATRCEAMLSR